MKVSRVRTKARLGSGARKDPAPMPSYTIPVPPPNQKPQPKQQIAPKKQVV